MAVAVPMFQLGFKETAGVQRVSPEKMVQTAVLLEVLASKASPLYEELLEKGLINTCHPLEANILRARAMPRWCLPENPGIRTEAAAMIREACRKLHETGVTPERFSWAKRAVLWQNPGRCSNNTESHCQCHGEPVFRRLQPV